MRVGLAVATHSWVPQGRHPTGLCLLLKPALLVQPHALIRHLRSAMSGLSPPDPQPSAGSNFPDHWIF